jgi:signal transduction histidine kinase
MVGLIAPTACGALIRLHRDLATALTDLTQARQPELDAPPRSRPLRRRARIAREIHDSVGHHSTLIAVQSAALAATAPASAASAKPASTSTSKAIPPPRP